MNKKVVVVGGSGFIGSHVADRLSKLGYLVTIYDCSTSNWLLPNQKMVLGDVLDLEKINKTLAGADIVYNFAAISDLNKAFNSPIDTVNFNILGNINILESCRLNNVSRFMFASSVYVHSREGGFYRCSKQASEAYIEEYKRIYGLNYTILRFGSLYGPRSDKSNGLYRIISSAIKKGVVSYEGHPESMREYIHVEDAAIASVDAISDDFENESIVLTGQEPMRVLDMLKMLTEILNFSEGVEFIENDLVGHYIRTPYSYQPKLGRKYKPSMHVDLGQGLIQMINEIQDKK